MIFSTKSQLNERAAYNCVDLTGYLHYPKKILTEILYAMENGCSKRQVDLVLKKYKGEDAVLALRNIAGTPDVEFYTEILAGAPHSPVKDALRDEIKILELLLPVSSMTHTWGVANSGFTLQFIQNYIDKAELDISNQIIHLVAADRYSRNNQRFTFKKEIQDAWAEVYGDIQTEDKNILPNSEDMEMLAHFFAICNVKSQSPVSICGHAAKDLGFSPRQTYRFMLETASFMMAIRNGIAAGNIFLQKNILLSRYEFTESGIIRKKLHASLCQEPRLLIEKIIQIYKNGEKKALDELMLNKPGRNQLLVYQMFSEAIYDSSGILKTLEIPLETQRYASEILSFFRKESTEYAFGNYG